MEGLAYIYMALAYEKAQTNNATQKAEKLFLEDQQYVASDRELLSEDVNKNYSNFCTAKF